MENVVGEGTDLEVEASSKTKAGHPRIKTGLKSKVDPGLHSQRLKCDVNSQRRSWKGEWCVHL